MNLVLIGYRATGKTTLARHLAQRLGWDWIDADVEIERRAGKSIARIFAEQGEPAFRDLEAEVIADLCGRPRAGRGRRRRGPAAGRKPPGDAGVGASRLADRHAGNDPRAHDRRCHHGRSPPRLTNRPPREEIVQLLGRREPIYRESAHLIVDTEGKSPEQLTDEILAGLRLSHNDDR